MALFRLSKIAEPEPLLRGDGLYLRPAVSGDFSAWVRLRSESREFLTPWEPIWPEDDLTRAAFRRRLRRQSDEMARDEAFSFDLFRAGGRRGWDSASRLSGCIGSRRRVFPKTRRRRPFWSATAFSARASREPI